MVDSCHVIQIWMAVGITDGHVVCSSIIFFEYRHDALGRKAMNSRPDRCLDQAGIRKRQKIKLIMNQVEFLSALKDCRDVQALPNFWVNCSIFGVWPRTN